MRRIAVAVAIVVGGVVAPAAVATATTPCGSARPPFWCGVQVSHHHWWNGLWYVLPGESA